VKLFPDKCKTQECERQIVSGAMRWIPILVIYFRFAV
jgi:hypothetical protein